MADDQNDFRLARVFSETYRDGVIGVEMLPKTAQALAVDIDRLRGLIRWASHHVPPGTEVEKALMLEAQTGSGDDA